MKNQLKKALKPTPDSFRCSILSAVREAEQCEVTAADKKHINKPLRILIAAALILAIIPTAVFGASRLIGFFAKPVDSYGVELNMETTNNDYPQYVKMHVAVPEGFEVEPNTDDLKYSATSGGGAFSLCPMRPTNESASEVVGNVGSYEEITLCGHTAYNISQISGDGAYDRLYVCYDDVNVLLLIYYNDITDDELSVFVSGVTFTEGSAGDHTELFEPFDERIENKVAYMFGYTNIEYDRDIVMTFRDYSQINTDLSLRYTAQITDVRLTDSISGLDSSLINQLYSEECIAYDSGKLLPRTVKVIQAGDRFSSIDTVISTEEKDQSLVLFDITYTNLSDEDTVVYMPYTLEVLKKDADGTFDYAWNIDSEDKITSTQLCDTEPFYVSDPLNDIKEFYCTELKAHETKTVTIGYRCCTDMLDKAYLTIIDASSEGVVFPSADEYENTDVIPNYIMKVM